MAEKKQFVLRLSPELFEALQGIAESEFRSVNGQIESVLSDYVRKRGYPMKPRESTAQDPKNNEGS